jgi:alpha-beta hydrolase superfamily lysophospholipase
LVVLVATLAGCGPVARLAQRQVERAALVRKPPRPYTPADVGVPYTRLWLEHDGRRLEAWLVRPADTVAAGSAVFICHGTGETLSDWVGALRLLREHGVTAFVFDYSGFGNSTGRPTAARLERDAAMAYRAFAAAVPPGTRRVVLGFSLGSGVALGALPRLAPAPDGVVLASAFSTGRQAAARRHPVQGLLAYLAPPGTWDNVAAVRTLRQPVLVVHSDADRAFPLAMARALVAAAPPPKALAVQRGYAHNALYAAPEAAQWAPIVAFIRGTALPAAGPPAP